MYKESIGGSYEMEMNTFYATSRAPYIKFDDYLCLNVTYAGREDEGTARTHPTTQISILS